MKCQSGIGLDEAGKATFDCATADRESSAHYA
jgi:hypothetical protein